MNEFFQCAVCFENFDTKTRVPRLLPCQHSFCSNCLPRLLVYSNRYYDFTYRNDYAGSCVECPICRAKHYTRVEDIPKSRLILNLIELTNGNQNNINSIMNAAVSRSKSPTANSESSKSSNSGDEALSPPSSPVPSTSGSSTSSSRNDLTSSGSASPVSQYSSSSTGNMANIGGYSRRIAITPTRSSATTAHPLVTQRTAIPITCSPVVVQQPTAPLRYYNSSNSSSSSSSNSNLNNFRSNSTLNLNATTAHRSREVTLRNQYYNPYALNGYLRASRTQSVAVAPSFTHTADVISATSSSTGSSNTSYMGKRILNTNRRVIDSTISTHGDQDWNLRSFLRTLFDDMDKDKDGYLCFDELQEALRRGQPNSEFNVKTVQLLFEKYDRQKQGEINFDGFYDMYVYLNNEYYTFVTINKGGTGTIDADELQETFSKRGYKFRREFFKFIENTMRETNRNGITFDNYCRLSARFDYLTNIYKSTPRYQASHTLESYLKKTFFFNFW